MSYNMISLIKKAYGKKKDEVQLPEESKINLLVYPKDDTHYHRDPEVFDWTLPFLPCVDEKISCYTVHRTYFVKVVEIRYYMHISGGYGVQIITNAYN